MGPASPEGCWDRSQAGGGAVVSGAGGHVLTQPSCPRATRTCTVTVSAPFGPAPTVACICP